MPGSAGWYRATYGDRAFEPPFGTMGAWVCFARQILEREGYTVTAPTSAEKDAGL